MLKKFVSGKDVYIIQPAGVKVNDNLMELLIAISACKTASARKASIPHTVELRTLVLTLERLLLFCRYGFKPRTYLQCTLIDLQPIQLFPYSRQNDIPYTPNKCGPLLSRTITCYSKPDFPYAYDSKPQTPHADHSPTNGLFNGVVDGLHKDLAKVHLEESIPNMNGIQNGRFAHYGSRTPKRSNTLDSVKSTSDRPRDLSTTPLTNGVSIDDNASAMAILSKETSPLKECVFTPRPGYKQWVAQAGKLVADLITCAGADHVITMELHDPRAWYPRGAERLSNLVLTASKSIRGFSTFRMNLLLS